jgi:hypothetical protein
MQCSFSAMNFNMANFVAPQLDLVDKAYLSSHLCPFFPSSMLTTQNNKGLSTFETEAWPTEPKRCLTPHSVIIVLCSLYLILVLASHAAWDNARSFSHTHLSSLSFEVVAKNSHILSHTAGFQANHSSVIDNGGPKSVPHCTDVLNFSSNFELVAEYCPSTP